MCQKSELCLVQDGAFYLWSSPSVATELTLDPLYVGHPQRPLVAPEGAEAGVVTHLDAGQASFTPITDLVEILQVKALFELKRGGPSR